MTENVGRIVNIAGPVVKCTGLPAVRMYEVVRVGNEKLIGEVIEVGCDEFTVQVYEETSGVSPGEPVVATGGPLSVELGPGLLGSIYDGIQRPLPDLKSLSGDFITRGLNVEGLNKEKKWQFRPTVAVKSKVKPGDVVGEVPETGIITSKIMVPVGIEGEVVSIAPPGAYTVVEPICKVKDRQGDIHDVIMMQRTAVRVGRPYKERVPMDTPLVTGQRVIDTFMPQAKGGTGAIPGGFGTGKCVLGNTPVLLANGLTVPIEQLYREHLSTGIVTEDSEDETLVQLRTPLHVISFDGTGYSSQKATHVYRGTTNRLVRVVTHSGRYVVVTPVHKLFRFDGSAIEEVEAGHLSVGDLLAVPRRLSLEGEEVRLDAYDAFLDYRAADPSVIQWMADTIQALKATMTTKEMAESLNVSHDVLAGYSQGLNPPTLRFLERLARLAGVDRVPVHSVKRGSGSKPFLIPPAVTPELAEWLGLFIAAGHFQDAEHNIRFSSTSERTLNRFVELTHLLFGLEASIIHGPLDHTPFAAVRSSGLRDLLRHLGVSRTDKTYRVRIPVCIMKSPVSIAVHFLAGYFAEGGTVSRHVLGISTTGIGLHTDVSYLLTRLGVLYKSRRKSGRGVLELDRASAIQIADVFLEHGVFSHDRINKLYQCLDYSAASPSATDLTPIAQTVLAFTHPHAEHSEECHVLGPHEQPHGNYTELEDSLSVCITGRPMESIWVRALDTDQSAGGILRNAPELTEEVYFDRVVKIESYDSKQPVFDITVEGSHNFVGGHLPFTLHNTVTLHQFAKWADAQVVVYVGCGERGNEMTEALEEWPQLKDPKSGRPLMERTVLIANTSNMPVAAREASIYVAITIAEYFRDQGFDVALMADSTSRWAEALREISGRLGQLPSEEGYPAYLGSRLAQFYERGGRMRVLGSDERLGSVTVCGAVSPPGGDFSEPVTQATLRIVKVFWALDKDLAARRFFPAINSLTSYSLYMNNLESWHRRELGEDWPELVKEAMAILQKDQELREIVQLVGPDALPESERATLEAARMIKEDFLTQSAIHEIDTFCPIRKTYRMLRVIVTFARRMAEAVKAGAHVRRILEFSVLDNIARMKIAPWDSFDKTMDAIEKKMNSEFDTLTREMVEAGTAPP
ncbi:MAG: V-type ATP synthase subunit A [Candidatus Thorarchaeota archaeon]|nr:V-type ATP synthase subunit A [Candidatus Thorarchaeota archaeon]